MWLTKLCSVLIGLAFAGGCNSKESEPVQPSTDIAKMLQVVKLPHAIGSARWEIFTYPDKSDGLLPDNYESTTFVAEISPSHTDWFSNSTNEIEINWTSPNAARPWLTPQSRKILSSDSLDLKSNKCRYFATELVKNAKSVTGFACDSNGQVLLYLLLDEKS
jgi:hypothetical protein